MFSSCCCEKDIPWNLMKSLMCGNKSFQLTCVCDMVDVVMYCYLLGCFSWVYSILQKIFSVIRGPMFLRGAVDNVTLQKSKTCTRSNISVIRFRNCIKANFYEYKLFRNSTNQNVQEKPWRLKTKFKEVLGCHSLFYYFLESKILEIWWKGV